jgi:hypothetical protein
MAAKPSQKNIHDNLSAVGTTGKKLKFWNKKELFI